MVSASTIVCPGRLFFSAATRMPCSQTTPASFRLPPRFCNSSRRRTPYTPLALELRSSRVVSVAGASASDTPAPSPASTDATPSVQPSDPLSQANNDVFDIDGQWLSSTTRHVYIFTGVPMGEGDIIDRVRTAASLAGFPVRL